VKRICVHWSSENSNFHIDKTVTFLGLLVWCGVSSRGIVGPLFFEGTVSVAVYLSVLQEPTAPTAGQLYGDEDMWYQQDGAPPTLPS